MKFNSIPLLSFLLMPIQSQGLLSGRYMLVPRTLIFITGHDRVLLLKGAPDKPIWANLYNGVGGHVEPGESILQAAQRELKEETGLSSQNIRLCGVITIDTGQNPGIGIYVFHLETDQTEIIPSREGDLEWIPFQQLDDLPLVEDLPDLLPRVLNMRPGDPPFTALYRYDADGNLYTQFGWA